MRVTVLHEGKAVSPLVHRLVCRAFNGPAPVGKNLVLHGDDNPTNNNSDNLRWGDGSDNMQDMIARTGHHNSKKTHCPKGHRYSPDNVYLTTRGGRACRTCIKAR